VLRAVAEHLNREVHLQPMLHSALALILQLLDLHTGWIFLLDEQGQFTLAAAHGLPPALEADGRAAMRWTPCQCQRLLLEGHLDAPANILDCERLQRVHEELAGADPQAVRAQTGDLHMHVTVPLRRQEAEVVRRLTQTLLGLTDLGEVGRAVFEVLREVLQPDALSLLVVDPSGTCLELVAGWGWSEAHVGRLQLPLHPADSSGPAWALHDRQPLLEDHTQPSGRFAVPDPVRRAGVRACLNLPMVAGDKPTGVLVADYLVSPKLDEDRIRFAAAIAGVAAVAVERALEHQRNRLLFERVPVALYRSTPEGRLLDVNDAMVRLLGYPDRQALLAVEATSLYANAEERGRWQQLLEREGVVVGFEVQWRRFDGTVVWVRESARVIRDATGRPAYYEGSAEDITARRRVEADLHYLANHDPLTGAYNRHRFREELGRLVAQARRSGEGGALLFLDLDNFKEVNDRLGHKAGDELLRAVARAVRARLREVDLLGRLGGDEFGVAAWPAQAGQAVAMAERVLAAVRDQVVLLEGRPVRLTASCGVALFPQHGLSEDELLAAADLSMYAAKEQGGDQVVLYQPEAAWRDSAGLAVGWAERLRRALAEDRLVAYAQPILDLRRGEVTQWEFLVRLVEGQEVIAPAAFLAAAERAHLIQQVDVWICRQALRFRAREGRRVHVNLSPRTLEDDQATEAILAEVDRHRQARTGLVVEVTETAAIANVTETLGRVHVLRSRGCQLALDDFGVGFSSLYYLRHLPVDYLKIDASFVRGLATDPQDRQIVRAIAELARGLGRATVAEGVEDAATLEVVRALGVDYAQGYYIGRPEPRTP
jgi:diguanylate cyclase (GGDEF)-like protein/PAS domain S-box-containing protein